MPISITVPDFPNVPQLPGVPQLVRSLLNPASLPPSLGAAVQGALWQSADAAPTWGVFDSDNNAVVVPDSFLDFNDSAEWKIPTYPIQQGGFGTYNKVIVPAESSVRMSMGGMLADRQAFLASIDAIAGDTNLYSILTPEKTYVNRNVTRSVLRRSEQRGAYWLTEVELYFKQINSVTAQYSSTSANTQNAQDPGAMPTVNQGLVQPVTVDPITSSVLSSAIG